MERRGLKTAQDNGTEGCQTGEAEHQQWQGRHFHQETGLEGPEGTHGAHQQLPQRRGSEVDSWWPARRNWVSGGWWRAFIPPQGRRRGWTWGWTWGWRATAAPRTSTPAAFPIPGPCVTSAVFGHSVGCDLQEIRKLPCGGRRGSAADSQECSGMGTTGAAKPPHIQRGLLKLRSWGWGREEHPGP